MMRLKMVNTNLTKKGIEALLNEQTRIILGAVDFKLSKTDKRLEKIDLRIAGIEARMGQLETRLNKVETKLNQKLDKLITTLDKFLKRLTDSEDEFTMMKADVNRVKAVLREKLGVAI